MRKIGIILIISLLSKPALCQLSIGVSTGVLLGHTTQSAQVNTQTNDMYFKSDSWDNAAIFLGVYVESGLLRKFKIKQELSFYQSSHTYKLLAPDNNPNSNFAFFQSVTSTIFTTINYRGMVSVFRRGVLYVTIGPSIDFNIVRVPNTDPPYYADSYPDAADLAGALSDSYNIAVLYADGEVGFNWKRFDLSMNYKYSLTSQTGKFIYDGNQHSVRSTTTQYFVRLGYRFLVREKQ